MSQENPSDLWEKFMGNDPTTLALPDFFSNYFAYSFDRSADDAQYVGLRITGAYAYARYMSYNIYDANEGKSRGGLTDVNIKPLPNNVNPFVGGSDPNATNRSYIINVLPTGYSTGGDDNPIIYENNKIKILTVIIRYYVPVGDYGNVALPTIQAFDVRTGQDIPLPKRYTLKGNKDPKVFSRALAPIYLTDVDDTLRFYHGSGAGQFDNLDNIYLINAVTNGVGQALLIRLKPPTYPKSNEEYSTADVRYWSFNECNSDTSTSIGVEDEGFKVSQDGFVYIAIGDEKISTKAKQLGYNFMPWKGERSKIVVVYRNLVTNVNFNDGNLNKVPCVKIHDLIGGKIYSMDAKNYIGDYAPTGKKVNQEAFLLSNNEFVSPGF